MPYAKFCAWYLTHTMTDLSQPSPCLSFDFRNQELAPDVVLGMGVCTVHQYG